MTKEDIDVFANDITLHIIDKLNVIFEHISKNSIGYLVQVINNKVKDLSNAYTKHSRNTQYVSLENIVELANDEDDIIDVLFINKEEKVEKRNLVLEMLSDFHTCGRFELLSFLATKIVHIKTSYLAQQIDSVGFYGVSEDYFRQFAQKLEINYDEYFHNLKNNEIPEYDDISTLCKKISHSSNNCSNKLKRKLAKRTK